MTFVQPKKQSSALTSILLSLLVVFACGVAGLVVVYNRVVDLEHNMVQLEKEYRVLETGSAELKEKVFSFFTTENLERFAEERQLIKEKKPRYFTDQQWAFAFRSL